MNTPSYDASAKPESESPATATADEELLAALADDFAARLRRGEHPSVEEYVGKHPALAERIRNVLSAAAMMEQTRALHSAPAGEGPGSVIGRYKLLERIGEGGFGVVYMAEQQQPIRRKVALKVVKPGMDSQQILARFEAERQALAIMDHPNIARVLDAGATNSGHPYFVMELVKGEPISEFCDRNQLDPRQRLQLFVQVCHAVQHAHQKGIIHRDLKPTNVLVAMHDTTPVVKVIDFGVAKALGQELTDRTLFTAFAQFLGTPLYMSPEQAGLSSLDVDTRSDIYSLGVLLYELLTGTTPFDKGRFRKAAEDEIRRIIREEEPPKPSTRLSESKEKLPSISAHRHTEPAKLAKLVRGELDWIVMKALEKDRSRRYETANGLARDVERYLHDEPVVACPPSTAYRLKKLVRRNKVALVTGSAIATTLVFATILSTWQAVRATRAQAEAEAATAREAKLRHDAEWQAKTAKAQSLAVTGDMDQAEAILRELPNDFIESNARSIVPIFRALAHWHAGEQRWRQSAGYYNALLFGPAKQSGDLYDHVIHASITPQALASPPWSLAYLEFAPLQIEIDDRQGYERLREAAMARYADSTVPNFCENMLHVTLLLPPKDSQMTTISKWAEIAATKDHSCHHAALALFNYRHGNHDQALNWCRKCFSARPYPAVAARAHVLEAMAYLRLNNPEDAEKELAEGRNMIEKKFSGHLGVGHYAGNLWADWLMARILLREADAMFQTRDASGKKTKSREI